MKSIFTLGIATTLLFFLLNSPSLSAKDSIWSKEAQLRPVLRLYAEVVPYIAALACSYTDKAHLSGSEETIHSIVYTACLAKAALDANRFMDALSDHIEKDYIW